MDIEQYKFTGTRIDNGKQVSGFLCQNFNGGFSIMPKAFFASVISEFDEDEDEDNYDSLADNGLAIGGFFDVVPESIKPNVESPISTVIDDIIDENTVKWAKRLLSEVDKDYNGLFYQNRLNENGISFRNDVKAFLKSVENK